jgi:hypothetical protein
MPKQSRHHRRTIKITIAPEQELDPRATGSCAAKKRATATATDGRLDKPGMNEAGYLEIALLVIHRRE